MAERVTIGKILRPKGLRGEVKVLPLTDIPDRFRAFSTVCITLPEGQDVEEKIIDSYTHNGFVYVRFAERESREHVENLIDGVIQAEQLSVSELPDNVYYHFEILDAEVYTDDDRRLGTVVEIIETGTHDVYSVRDGEREYLIPATTEVVRQIDRERKVIIIHPLEGLLDL